MFVAYAARFVTLCARKFARVMGVIVAGDAHVGVELLDDFWRSFSAVVLFSRSL